jgi:CRP-like cAMP-binding protein
MESELLQFVSKFEALTEADRQAIVAHIVVQTFKKGTILLHEGEISTQCFFVLKGCIRQYTVSDGEEKSIAFFTEEQAAVSFTSYTQQVPCNHYFACVEDCVVIVGDPQTEAEMRAQLPVLAEITRMMMEQDFGKTQMEFATFITSSPEERYRHLLQTRPALLQRVPQHQIASYLGVTPESLSRIRKRIAQRP